MNYSMKHIGSLLKKARLQKGLSQQALALQVGLPQSHLSKIENGRINLQISTLIELLRVLELELMIVPHTLVQTVEVLKRGMDEKVSEPRPMYQLSGDDNEE